MKSGNEWNIHTMEVVFFDKTGGSEESRLLVLCSS